MKILIVEDSKRLRESIEKGLGKLGYCVHTAGDGAAGLLLARNTNYDVIVLDIMLPKIDGFTVLREIRSMSIDSAVLILSARDAIDDRISGLDSGADDYLVKPFSFDELCARIRTLGRRRYQHKSPLIHLHGLIIDTPKREVRTDATGAIALTASEYIIIETLALRRGFVFSKDALHERIQRTDSESTSNVIEVLVSSLRRKLASHGIADVVITKRGFGYVIK